MAEIGTSLPHLSVGGPDLSEGNRGRRRHYGRGGRGGRASRNDQEATTSPAVGQEPQQQQQQPQQKQQQQPSGRQRGGKLRGEGMSPNSHSASAEPDGQSNQLEQPSARPKAPRQWNKRRRGGGNGDKVSGPQNGQPQQLNWQQQLLLENSQQQPQRGQGGSSRGRGGGLGGGSGQQRGRDRREPQDAPTTFSGPAPAPGSDRTNRGRIAAPRGFGTRLTVTDPAASPTASGSLRPGASSFEPGALVHSEVNSNAHTADPSYTENWGKDEMDPAPEFQPSRKTQAQSAATVKEAEDLMTRIHKGIASGNYECMICYGGVTRKSQVWDCGRCYAVFHLKCIQKWAKQGLDAPLPPNALENGGYRRRTWRCPGCQNPDSELPSIYECWCGKTQIPEVQRYIAPHSCGQPCGKGRISPRACPHPCNLQCHAGPCPPCTAMGPVQACFCGKESTQRRCLDTNYENGWSCQQICGDYMPCGEHTCPKLCHSGLCGDCEFEEELSCYCGRQSRLVKCCDKGVPLKSIQNVEGDAQQWIGHWSCKTDCERFFDCGKHKCSKPCHVVDLKPAHCPFSPDNITHCPCGRTNLNEILPKPRETCEDLIPACGKPCNKTLKCGHKCQETCHTDDCGVCLQTMEVNCRCGRTLSTSLCHQGNECEPPQCMRTCRIILNCQRHECGEKCCSGESGAMERIAASKKKKQRPLNSAPNRSDEVYEPEHICTRVCGKLLKCGKHPCPMLCHRGPCGTCLEASFEELACNCGRTVIHPPVPCGSRPPQCPHECAREKACGHPRTSHNCHGDENPCPKCPYLTVKRCVCGKKDIKNQPCWREGVTCGTICGKKLSCGSHTCKKVCHKDGECDELCTQPCGKLKTCGHLDTDSCHAPFQCTETVPCQSKLQISCSCGGIKQEVKCNATRSSPGSKGKEIKCNDTCRARRMAIALQIDPERESADKMGYSDETVEMYNEQPKQFAQSIEKTLRTFAEAQQKRLAFQPMKSQLRQFIHLLAIDFGLESESQDPEPYRSVVVMKGPKFTTAPKKTIAEFIRSSAKSTAFSTHAPTPAPTPIIEQLRKPVQQAVNALVLEGIRIGLLMNELEKELDPLLCASQLKFNIHWTADEEVVLEPKSGSFGMDEIELELSNMKAPLRRAVKTKGLANEVELCWVAKGGKIIHKENQRWATVLGPKGSASSSTPAWGGRPGIAIAQNGFGALDPSSASRMVALGGGRSSSESLREKERKEREKEKEKDKKKVEEEVVDDWEAAADEDEARNIQAEGGLLKGEEQAQNETADTDPSTAGGDAVEPLVPTRV